VILSKRERYVFIGVVLVVALLGLDHYILTPLLEYRNKLKSDLVTKQGQLKHDESLKLSSARLRARWADMLKAGMNADGPSAENQVLHSVRDWALEAGVSLPLLKPERTDKHDKQKEFRIKTFRVTGTGSMKAVSRFLWRIQTAKLPVRITDLTLTPKKEGTDDLSLDLGLSTLYLSNEPEKAAAGQPPLVFAREERP
jgi:hypothetical protein